ncbi:murein transglycosylase [Parafrankia soli]|uniref:Murein transglycosylase n=1 Tax=Parafrankia soli TaxID=2599596 RepID=A0A1S1R3K1_9ACTN|nr:murein transglycosylase [Parafrankia soli]OHV40486.1 murein transglycosylase [Parafrankia soli]
MSRRSTGSVGGRRGGSHRSSPGVSDIVWVDPPSGGRRRTGGRRRSTSGRVEATARTELPERTDSLAPAEGHVPTDDGVGTDGRVPASRVPVEGRVPADGRVPAGGAGPAGSSPRAMPSPDADASEQDVLYGRSSSAERAAARRGGIAAGRRVRLGRRPAPGAWPVGGSRSRTTRSRDLAGGRGRRRDRDASTNGSWSLPKIALAATALALAVTAVAGPSSETAAAKLTGPVNGRVDQTELLPEGGAAFGGATVEDLASVVGASGQVRLPVRAGLAASPVASRPAGSATATSGTSPTAGASPSPAGTASTGTATAGASDDGTVRNAPLATPPGSSKEASTIPARALAAYTNAADRAATEHPGCYLHWSVLAGIGAIESGHGQGARTDSNGRVAPTVVGPRLDGSPGMFRIRDTDDGWLDGDTVWDRAVGPMQFTPSMWRWIGRDADGDGRADPNDFDDATLTAADRLCQAGGDLRVPDNVLSAVRSYNPSDGYIRSVLGWAAWYAVGPTVVGNLGTGTADPAGAGATGGDGGDPTTDALATDQPFQVTTLVPLPGSSDGTCVAPVIDQASISAGGVGGDVVTGSEYESLEVRARVGGTAERTVTIELTLLDETGATVATGVSARALPGGDGVVPLGRLDGLAIGRATGRGPFDVKVQVLPAGQDCQPVQATARVGNVDPADFAGAPSTLASLRRRLETYRDTGRITQTAAADLLATLPAGDGGLQASVELARFLDRLAAAIRIGEIAADAATGLGDVANALQSQLNPPASTPPAGGTPSPGTNEDVPLPFDVVPLAPGT